MLAPDSSDKPQVTIQPLVRESLFISLKFREVALFTLLRGHATQRKTFGMSSKDDELSDRILCAC
jgi:hypothetical protein